MSRVTLDFVMPEDKADLQLAMRGPAYQCAIGDMLDYLRSEIKYNDTKYSEKELELLEAVRTKFWEILNDNDVGEFI